MNRRKPTSDSFGFPQLQINALVLRFVQQKISITGLPSCVAFSATFKVIPLQTDCWFEMFSLSHYQRRTQIRFVSPCLENRERVIWQRCRDINDVRPLLLLDTRARRFLFIKVRSPREYTRCTSYAMIRVPAVRLLRWNGVRLFKRVRNITDGPSSGCAHLWQVYNYF